MDPEAAARAEIRSRLAVSREELRRLLDPPQQDADAPGSNHGAGSGGFPRSHIMQMLMSQRGLGMAGAAAAGLLMARPALALRLLRLLPASEFARMLLSRAITALRTKKE